MPGLIREQLKKVTRSSGWSKVRKKKILKTPSCACCGRRKRLQVHHIEDFSTYPEKELDLNNLIVFCGRCHLLIGHLNYWKSINPDSVGDALDLFIKIVNRR